VTKALQLHPSEASLWIYASVWEFEHNRNAGAARALMQRGLRMCPGSAELWAEYFRLELLYAHTLRMRRKILGITTPGPRGSLFALCQSKGDCMHGMQAPNVGRFSPLDCVYSQGRPVASVWVGLTGEEGAQQSGKEADEATPQGSEEAVQRVLSGAVAVLVFRQAASELPKTVAVRRKFLDALTPFTFPGVEAVAEVKPRY
jgi:U3 small nucleolar RNA-associated protein 6